MHVFSIIIMFVISMNIPNQTNSNTLNSFLPRKQFTTTLLPQHNMFDGATSFNQTSIYCNWQSNDDFKNDPNVCSNNGANCGWGQTSTSCLGTPAPVPAPTSPPPTTPAAPPTTPSPPTTTLVPTISLATKYFIALVENSTVARFNDTNSANEITFNLNITKSDLDGFNGESVTVLEYDTCSGEAYAESVVSAVPDIPNKMIDGIYAEVPILVDVNTTDIENISSVYPGYFNATNEETAVLKFCVMSKLGESTIYNSTSNTTIMTAISYSKVKVQVEIDMKKGFESVSVSVTEDNPKEEVAESTVDYERKWFSCNIILVSISNPSLSDTIYPPYFFAVLLLSDHQWRFLVF